MRTLMVFTHLKACIKTYVSSTSKTFININQITLICPKSFSIIPGTKMSYRILRGFTAVSVIGILIWFCILVKKHFFLIFSQKLSVFIASTD